MLDLRRSLRGSLRRSKEAILMRINLLLSSANVGKNQNSLSRSWIISRSYRRQDNWAIFVVTYGNEAWRINGQSEINFLLCINASNATSSSLINSERKKETMNKQKQKRNIRAVWYLSPRKAFTRTTSYSSISTVCIPVSSGSITFASVLLTDQNSPLIFIINQKQRRRNSETKSKKWSWMMKTQKTMVLKKCLQM